MKKNVYAHGAIDPLRREGEWIYFGASVGYEAYPVVFMTKDVPELIEWLKAQVQESK